MNLRFPEVFGLLLFAALLSSFVMPRSLSGRIENTFQFVFAPVTGPIQWVAAGKDAAKPRDVPLLPEVTDEVVRLRAEKNALLAYVETLRGQVLTLSKRQTDAEIVGVSLSDRVTEVKVIGPDAAAGRDVLRLTGTTAAIQKDQPVVGEAGIVGKISEVGVGKQGSVRLVTDRGFKLLGKFDRIRHNDAGEIELAEIQLRPTIVEGVGGGVMRVEGLKMADVRNSTLAVGDIVVLADTTTEQWPIEVHGRRVGTVTKVSEKVDAPGVAEIWVKPDVDLLKLEKVLVVTGK